MTKEEFKVIVKRIRRLFNAPNFLGDKEILTIWFESLKGYKFDLVELSVERYASCNKYPPHISDLKEISHEIVSENTKRRSVVLEDFNELRNMFMVETADLRQCQELFFALTTGRTSNIDKALSFSRQILKKASSTEEISLLRFLEGLTDEL